MSQQDGGNDKKKRGFWGWLKGEPAAETPVAPEPAPIEPEPAPSDVAPEAPAPAPLESVAAEAAEVPAPEPVAPEPVAEAESQPVAEAEPELVAEVTPEPVEVPQPVEAPAPEPTPALAAEAPPPDLPPPAEEPAAPAPEPRKGFWSRLASGLARTASSLGQGITDLVSKRKLDAATLEELEEVLIRADLGVETSMRIVEDVGRGRHDKMISAEEVKSLIAAEVERILAPVATPLVVDTAHKPFILLMVGVNGSGKTTTIGKLASQWRAEGRKVVLAAGDTFRAAAIEQLKVWGQRTGATVIAREQGADAAGVAHDAITEARAQNADILMIDTAGRLQNRTELMAELEKVVRVIKKQEPTAPHAVLLVLDATVGQNALSQVEAFARIAGVTGLVMTKLDGTARGGILVAIAAKHKLPIHLIGVGEGQDDLQPFAARDFARAIAGLE
ncbi:signal recognition particle-docking protein FtsY [Xanthobacter autotrophicus]|uniref:signal recognition particle-docking protein FtsY n=1 Tax=Xanthobacter autotrophicus TaxID=280 RepID=UPI001E5B8FAA|nr:signal recognition particle-docking protein FtsY [Xanthobacter autotrophicus]UDQ91210.1 signal recognition particle-docking protein FtsY [Xanthobacter autotrophicus]